MHIHGVLFVRKKKILTSNVGSFLGGFCRRFFFFFFFSVLSLDDSSNKTAVCRLSARIRMWCAVLLVEDATFLDVLSQYGWIAYDAQDNKFVLMVLLFVPFETFTIAVLQCKVERP